MKERKTEEIKILFLFAREICACLPYGLSARMLHGFRRDLLRAPTPTLSCSLPPHPPVAAATTKRQQQPEPQFRRRQFGGAQQLPGNCLTGGRGRALAWGMSFYSAVVVVFCFCFLCSRVFIFGIVAVVVKG